MISGEALVAHPCARRRRTGTRTAGTV